MRIQIAEHRQHIAKYVFPEGDDWPYSRLSTFRDSDRSYLSLHILGLLVLTERDEFAMPKMSILGPLDEFELRDEHRL